MRLHPGVALILERIVPEGGMSVNNYYIPAGTNVGVNPAVIHHDKTIYGVDADDFRPERWLEAGEDQIKAMDRNLLTVCPFLCPTLFWLFSLCTLFSSSLFFWASRHLPFSRTWLHLTFH